MITTLDQEYDSSKFFLQSVNVLLQMINQLPLNDDVELLEVLEGQLASSVLIETKKEVLSSKWDFNSDTNYSFPPDTNGYISIPANVLDITDSTGDVIMRDWRLYSKSGQTAIFAEPVAVDVVWDIEFNNLTHPLRNFITVRAARKFQARQVMDTSVYSYSQADEDDAYLAARRSEGFTGKYNILESGNYGTFYKVR